MLRGKGLLTRGRGFGLIELNELESHLWEAANILRGPVDAADFKISDVYDEELDAALEDSDLDEIRENGHNLNIPRYVEPVIEEETITVDKAIANLKESLQAAYAAEDKLRELLKREGMTR